MSLNLWFNQFWNLILKGCILSLFNTHGFFEKVLYEIICFFYKNSKIDRTINRWVSKKVYSNNRMDYFFSGVSELSLFRK